MGVLELLLVNVDVGGKMVEEEHMAGVNVGIFVALSGHGQTLPSTEQ